LMCDLHDRMPVILPRAAEDTWLNPETDSETVKNLLKRYPASEMRYYPVSQAVNSPKIEGEALIQPI